MLIKFKDRVKKEEYLALKNGVTDIYKVERYTDIFRGDAILIACENSAQEIGEVSEFEVTASRFDKETNTYTLRVKFVCVHNVI